MGWKAKRGHTPEERIAYWVTELNKNLGFKTHATDEEAIRFWARELKPILEAEETTVRIEEIAVLHGPRIAEKARQYVFERRMLQMKALDDMRKRRLEEEAVEKGIDPIWEPT